jgi:hypothetical protein
MVFIILNREWRGILNREWTRMDANEEKSALLGQGDSDPFEFAMLEIDDETDGESGDAEVVHHLTALAIGNLFDGLGVDDDLLVGDKIRYELPDSDLPPVNGEPGLLEEWNSAVRELDSQGVLIRLFVQPVAQAI